MSRLMSVLLLGTLLCSGTAFSDTTPAADGKVYVKRRAVRFIDDKIVVFTPDGAFTTPAINSDDNGIYVVEKDLTKSDAKIKGKGHCKKKARFHKSHGRNKRTCGTVPPHVVKKLSENKNVPQAVVDKLSAQ
jgi:hypothetical protein